MIGRRGRHYNLGDWLSRPVARDTDWQGRRGPALVLEKNLIHVHDGNDFETTDLENVRLETVDEEEVARSAHRDPG